MADPTEIGRAILTELINNNPQTREQLEAAYGQVWNTQELTRDFSVVGFGAPFVIVTRKADGQKGSLTFQHQPRFYFEFTPDSSA